MTKATTLTHIECDASARDGMTLVLKTRFEEMCSLRDAALDWSDPEGVHNMRVASRRLRGALSDFMPFLRKRRHAAYLEQIRVLARALGRVRDYDVEIMTLENTATKAPSEIARGILEFARLRNAARDEAREKLSFPLDPDGLLKLKSKFASALERDPGQKGKEEKQKVLVSPGVTYREAATSILLSRLEELETLSNSLYHPLKAKPQHEMRIAAKHLRYALELFEPCWGLPITPLATKVAALQTSLGKLHDCDIWIERFGKAATKPEPPVDFDYRATAVWLLCHFMKLRNKHLIRALSEWNEWERDGLSAQLRQLVQSDSSEPAANLAVH